MQGLLLSKTCKIELAAACKPGAVLDSMMLLLKTLLAAPLTDMLKEAGGARYYSNALYTC